MSLFTHDDDDYAQARYTRGASLRDDDDPCLVSPPPEAETEEDEAELITIALRADDPLLQALMESSNQDGKAVIEHALQVGIDFLRLEAMDALTRTYELKVAGLEARLRALKAEAMETETPAMPPKSPLKRFWALLTTKEEG